MLNMMRPRLLASSEDLANYLIGEKVSLHYQIFCVLEIDGNLDVSLLMQATKWVYQAEPVLNCQLVLDAEQPYWKYRLSYNRQEVCSVVETEDIDYAIQSFMSVSLDPCHDSLVQVRLLRKKNQDYLCVKISHACSDAVGVKEYIALLAAAYNALAQGKAFAPKPVVVRRDFNLILEHLGLKHYQELPGEICPAPILAAGLPAVSREYSIPRWTKYILSKNEYNKLKSYAAAKAVTINDVLFTAFCRAYTKVTEQQEYSVILTIDLRRFSQKVSLVANFSGGFSVNAGSYHGENFGTALLRFAQSIKKAKGSLPGVQAALKLDKSLALSFSDFQKQLANERSIEQGASPIFSNTGFFSPQILYFGETAVKNAYILPPPLFAPGFLLLMSTYNDMLTISTGYYQPAVPRATMDILMATMLQELKYCY